MKVYLGVTEQKLGEVLRKYRTKYGYTQKKVADYLGIDRTTYTKYETVRKPEIEVIMKLAAFYDVSVDCFLGDFFSQDEIKKSKFAVANKSDNKELFSLSNDEKQLINFYRESVRKAEILDNARAIWLKDVEAASEE